MRVLTPKRALQTAGAACRGSVSRQKQHRASDLKRTAQPIADSSAAGRMLSRTRNFFCKNAFHKKATPFLWRKPFLDGFLEEGA